MIEPSLLRTTAGGYEVVAVERRWRAAQIAGLHEIPAVKSIIVDRLRG